VYKGSAHTPAFDFYVNKKKLTQQTGAVTGDYTVTYTNETNAGNFLTSADAGVLTEAGNVTVILTAVGENQNIFGQAIIQFVIDRSTAGTLSAVFANDKSIYDVTTNENGVTFNPTYIITTTTVDIRAVLSYRYKTKGAADSTAAAIYPTTAGEYTVLAYLDKLPANYSRVNGVDITADNTPIKVAEISAALTIVSRVFIQLTVNTSTAAEVSVWFDGGAEFKQTVSGTDDFVTSLVITGLKGATGKINAKVKSVAGKVFNLSWTPNTNAASVPQIATDDVSTKTDIIQVLYLAEVYTIDWYSYDGTDELLLQTTSVLHNQSISVNAPTRADWVFDGWTDNEDAGARYDGYWTIGDRVLTGLTVSNVTAAKKYYALFVEKPVDTVQGVTVNPAINNYNGAMWQLLSVGGRVVGDTPNRNVTMFYMVKLVTENAPTRDEIVANNKTGITQIEKRDAGTYLVYYVARSEGGSEYSPTGVSAVTIRKADISINVDIKMLLADGSTQFTGGTYNGSNIAPDIVKVIFAGHITTLGDGILSETQDYTKTYRNTYQGGSIYSYNYEKDDLLKLTGTIRITVEGCGNYTGIAYIEYEIKPADLADATEIILTGVDNFIYDGAPHVPASAAVSIGSLNVPTEDYKINLYYRGSTITYNYTDAGTLGIVLSAKPGSRNFTGSTPLNFTGSTYVISKRQLTQENLSVYVNYDEEYAATYTGAAQKIIHPSLKSAYSGLGDIIVYYEGVIHDASVYAKTTTAPTQAGAYTVTISAAESINFYEMPELLVGTYTIAPRNIGDEVGNEVYITINGDAADYVYTGFIIIPTYTVSHPMTVADLAASSDFTFLYENNINAGNKTGIIILTGIGNYTGTARGFFTITPANIADVDITYTSPSVVEYNGAVQSPTFLATLGAPPKLYTLITSDYAITYLNKTVLGDTLTNNDPNVLLKAGTVTITITPRGTNFTGAARQFTYTILPYNLSAHADDLTVSFANLDSVFNAYLYTGNEITPVFTVTSTGIAGGNIGSYTDFIPAVYNNVNAGSYAVYGINAPNVVLTGMGNFTGEYIAYFKIVSKIVININNTNVTGMKPQINVWFDTTGKLTYQTAKYKATGNNTMLTLEGIEGESGVLKAEYTTNGTYCLTDSVFVNISTDTETDVLIAYYDTNDSIKTDIKQNRAAQIRIAQLYKIEYKCTGAYLGTVPAPQYKIHGTSYTVAANTLTRAGYEGNGWNSSDTVKTTPDYANGALINQNAAATLYANWRAKMYEIRFMALVSPITGTFEYTEAADIRIPNIEYNTSFDLLLLNDYPYGFPSGTQFPITSYHKGIDYKFVGWSITPQTAFAATDTIPAIASLPAKLTNNTILYAVYSKTTSTRTFNIVWKSKFYLDGDDIRYDINGQTVGISQGIYNSAIYAMANEFVPATFTYNDWVYQFKGWTDDSGAGYNDKILTGDVLARVREDATFYAVYDRMSADPYR
jgi:hypothetical protein